MPRLLRRGGPLLALALVVAAAAASLFGVAAARRVAGSPLFIAGAALVGAASLAAAITASRARRWSSLLLHSGLVVALVGIGVNQLLCRPGFVYLEHGGAARPFYLSRDLRLHELLPVAGLRLESLSLRESRGFRPAMVAWTGVDGAAPVGVTWNRPLALKGLRLMLSQVVEPGFLDEYELAVDSSEYLLLHNQLAEPAPGVTIQSFAFDPEQGRVGLRVNQSDIWLAAGDMAVVDGHSLRLQRATFARAMGVIYAVNDTRFRPVIFAGLCLSLAGLLFPLLRREKR